MSTPTVIFLGAGDICVSASTHTETNTPALTFRRLEAPGEPGSLLQPSARELNEFIAVVVVPTRPAAQVIYAVASAILARFPVVEGEKFTDAQTVAELAEQVRQLRALVQTLKEQIRDLEYELKEGHE